MLRREFPDGHLTHCPDARLVQDDPAVTRFDDTESAGRVSLRVAFGHVEPLKVSVGAFLAFEPKQG